MQWVVGRTQGLNSPSVKWGNGTCHVRPSLARSSTLRTWTVSAAQWVWWKRQPSGFLLSPDFHLDPLSRWAERLATPGHRAFQVDGRGVLRVRGAAIWPPCPGRLSACPSYVCLRPSLSLGAGPGWRVPRGSSGCAWPGHSRRRGPAQGSRLPFQAWRGRRGPRGSGSSVWAPDRPPVASCLADFSTQVNSSSLSSPAARSSMAAPSLHPSLGPSTDDSGLRGGKGSG